MSQFAVDNRVFPTQQVFNTCSWIIDSEISQNSCISTQVTTKHNSRVLLVSYFFSVIFNQQCIEFHSFYNATLNVLRHWVHICGPENMEAKVSKINSYQLKLMWLPWRLSSNETTYRRRGFYPWVRKIPQKRKRQPLQYSHRRHPMDRGAWWATAHGVAKSQTQLRE